jgi:hypothetical protein
MKLFLTAIEEQNEEMINYTDWYLYRLYTSQKQNKNGEPILRRALDNIERWTQRTNYKILTQKIKTIVFTRPTQELRRSYGK